MSERKDIQAAYFRKVGDKMTREERVRQMAIPVADTKSSPNRPDWVVKNSAFEEASMSIEDRIRQNAKERIASYLSARNKVVI